MKEILAELEKVSKDVQSADIKKDYDRAMSNIENAFKEISKLSDKMKGGITNQNQFLSMWGFWSGAKKNLKVEFGKHFDTISKAVDTLKKNKEWTPEYRSELRKKGK